MHKSVLGQLFMAAALIVSSLPLTALAQQETPDEREQRLVEHLRSEIADPSCYTFYTPGQRLEVRHNLDPIPGMPGYYLIEIITWIPFAGRPGQEQEASIFGGGTPDRGAITAARMLATQQGQCRPFPEAPIPQATAPSPVEPPAVAPAANRTADALNELQRATAAADEALRRLRAPFLALANVRGDLASVEEVVRLLIIFQGPGRLPDDPFIDLAGDASLSMGERLLEKLDERARLRSQVEAQERIVDGLLQEEAAAESEVARAREELNAALNQ